jgi:hypothetical protein
MSTTRDDAALDKVGSSAYASIQEMVAALQCDYDRLAELREGRDGFEDDNAKPRSGEKAEDYGRRRWAEENPDEAEELAALEEAAGDCESEDNARDRIMEDPLSLRIFGERTDGEWEATNFELLLGTGGPAVRIVGDIGTFDEPSSARLEVQDWFKPWTEYTQAESDVLLAYAGCFYFGD